MIITSPLTITPLTSSLFFFIRMLLKYYHIPSSFQTNVRSQSHMNTLSWGKYWIDYLKRTPSPDILLYCSDFKVSSLTTNEISDMQASIRYIVKVAFYLNISLQVTALCFLWQLEFNIQYFAAMRKFHSFTRTIKLHCYS